VLCLPYPPFIKKNNWVGKTVHLSSRRSIEQAHNETCEEIRGMLLKSSSPQKKTKSPIKVRQNFDTNKNVCAPKARDKKVVHKKIGTNKFGYYKN
jgi:hypothetical protein